MSDCPHCAALTEAARNAEAANAILIADHHKAVDELHERIDALTASLTTAHRQTNAYKQQLAKLHREDPQADTILACLAVWEQCCWAGKRRPSISLDDKRAGLVRRALKLPRLGEADICDAFRGLGLLPYAGKHGRAATPGPGVKRYADVEHALRDAPTLERFRDYYRRTQATEAERLRERLEQQWAVERTLFDTYLRVERADRHAKAGHWVAGRAGEIPEYVAARVEGVLELLLGAGGRGVNVRGLALAATLAVDSAIYEHEAAVRGNLEQRRDANARGHLFVIEGGEKAA